MRRPLALATALAVAAVVVPGGGALASAPSGRSLPGLAPSGLAQSVTAAVARPAAAATSQGGFTLSGASAAAYRLPGDLREQWTARYPDGTSQTRYQQVVAGAEVLNGQVTLLRDRSGKVTSVVGAHYGSLQPTSARRLSAADAVGVVTRLLGAAGRRTTTLRIDPRDGRRFFEVDTRRSGSRPVVWVDATNGSVVNRFSALTEGEGVGLKGDTKTIDTSGRPGAWRMISKDGRQETYDAGNRTTLPGSLMTDPDDVWDRSQPATLSPSQAAGVDAHYYANLVDDFYGIVFGRNSIDGNGMEIVSTVHYDVGYCNAFWNGEQMTYGDGDGSQCKPLSGGLDVVAHELTHGVTEFTSGLIYENESGALNEAFSDMMGNTTEFFAAQRKLDKAAKPDWLIGEDVIPAGPVYGGTNPGFRNMGDPEDDGDPDHYSERYQGTDDNGGVHTNSGIPNHAYYLVINGGRNAGCDSVGSGGHRHTADCGVSVPKIGTDKARTIFYKGFTSLTDYANMCDARAATVAVSGSYRTTINAAWAAVGVKSGCKSAVPPPPPCVGDTTAQVPFESPHPYGNNGDCTWTFDNGTGGFAFHFSLLETEAGYDYVHVKDADGKVLASYDGTHPLPGGVTSPCIPTRKGSVQLVTDQAVTDEGFTVDAVEPC